MKDRLISYLSPPIFTGDDEKTWRAQVINTLLLSYTLILLLAMIAAALFFENKIASITAIFCLLAVILFTLVLLHRGYVTIAGILMAAGLFFIACALVWFSGGVNSPMVILYISGLVVSGLVFGPRGSLAYGISALIFYAVLLAFVWTGYELPRIFPLPPLSVWLLLLIAVGFVVIPLNISLRNFSSAIRLAREEIIERRLVEARLRESEQRYRNFLEQSIDGIWRLAFNEPIPISLPPEEQVRLIQYTGYIAECNNAIARMYGYGISSELVGKRLIDLYGGSPSPVNTQSTLRLVSENYRSANRETHEVDRFGQPVYFINNAVGIIENGNLVGIWGTQRDITEQRLAAKEREELIARLERQNAELERFTYTVSHDLKSPLITIRGFLGFIERDAVAGKVDRIKADLARIASASDKMQHLLNDLLELSRVGRLLNPPVLMPFTQVVEEALALVHGTLVERGANVQVSGDLPFVYGDRARLVEVVQNLVDNAAKFMGDQPAPLIEIGCSGTDADGSPILYVRDNGIGIEPRFQERVFGLFDKLDPQTEGTGVGLALVKRIVEVHGGRVWVESKGGGQGSTFYFSVKIPGSMSPANTL